MSSHSSSNPQYQGDAKEVSGPSIPLSCLHCKYATYSMNDLLEHDKASHEEGNPSWKLHCPVRECYYRVQECQALYVHAVECHPEIMKYSCYFTFRQESQIAAYFDAYDHKCGYCFFGCDSKFALGQHSQLYHRGLINSVESSEKPPEQLGDFAGRLKHKNLSTRIEGWIKKQIALKNFTTSDCIFALPNCHNIIGKITFFVFSDLKKEYLHTELARAENGMFINQRLAHVSYGAKAKCLGPGVISNTYRQILCRELFEVWKKRYETSQGRKKISVAVSLNTQEAGGKERTLNNASVVGAKSSPIQEPFYLSDVKFWESVIDKVWGPPEPVVAPVEWQPCDFFLLGLAFAYKTNKQDDLLHRIGRNDPAEASTQIEKCKAELTLRKPHTNIDVLLRGLTLDQPSSSSWCPVPSHANVNGEEEAGKDQFWHVSQSSVDKGKSDRARKRKRV